MRTALRMRAAFDPQLRLDSTPIDEVKHNVNCRDEIVPILRSLQHIYAAASLRATILGLIASDVNGESRAAIRHPPWPRESMADTFGT